MPETPENEAPLTIARPGAEAVAESVQPEAAPEKPKDAAGESEAELLTLRMLRTDQAPYPRMVGTEFQWPDGEDARQWIAAGKCELITAADVEVRADAGAMT